MTVKCFEDGCLCTKPQLRLTVKISLECEVKLAGRTGEIKSAAKPQLCVSPTAAAVVTCRNDLSWDDCCFLTSDKRQKQRPALLFLSLTENN